MCTVTATGDWRARGIVPVGQIGGGFSHESEHDLALMVSDFLENGTSSGGDSWCSSDGESGLSDLHHLADKISFYKQSLTQHESELQSLVHSRMQSIKDTDLGHAKSASCNGSCIRFYLAKLLRLSGYDAAVCSSRWQGSGKVPGGDHEYIDVVDYKNTESFERLIVDIDFRSHFEIARAVDSYARILKSLPVVYVGSLARLKQYLQVMVEASKSSLKQNSMPLPPWRSLAYLEAKWYSPHQRRYDPEKQSSNIYSLKHKQCNGHLKRLQSLLQSEIEEERIFKSIKSESNWKVKFERRRHSLLRGL